MGIRATLGTALFLGMMVFTPGLTGDEPKEQPAGSLTPEEKAVLELTNKEREKEQLPPLKPNAKLTAAARAHSLNMAKQDKLDHELDGKNPADRARAAGYRYVYLGENVGEGSRTAEKILKLWMESPGHKANILDKRF